MVWLSKDNMVQVGVDGIVSNSSKENMAQVGVDGIGSNWKVVASSGWLGTE